MCECYLCGSRNNLTKDHLFPRSLFPDPKPKNLITLDCCRKCQDNYMADEEYFRNMLIASKDVYETNGGKKIWDTKVLRGLTRTRGIQKQTFEKLKTVELKTQAGLFIGKQKAFLIDKERFDKVLEKFVRGLHFLHTGFRVVSNDDVIVKWDLSEKSLTDLSEYHRYIQVTDDFNDIVGYRGAGIDTGRSSMWWIHFFRKHICVAFVLELQTGN